MVIATEATLRAQATGKCLLGNWATSCTQELATCTAWSNVDTRPVDIASLLNARSAARQQRDASDHQAVVAFVVAFTRDQ